MTTRNKTTPGLSFLVSKEDRTTIIKIADRLQLLGVVHDHKTIRMYVTACHANRCPLRLADALTCPPHVLLHDYNGIVEHLDRTTGALNPAKFDPQLSVTE